MNEETKELLKFLIETLKETKGFVYEQAPEIAKEIIIKGVIYHSFLLLLFIILSCIFGVVAYYCWKDYRQTKDDDPLLITVSAFFLLASLLVSMANVYWLLIIYFTPKLYLLREIAFILKK